MPERFVTVTEAKRRVGLSAPTWCERVRRGEIVLYSNPRDRRSRLVAVEDLDRLMTPQPLPVNNGDRVPVAS